MKRNTEYLKCLICGKKVKNLGQHFFYSHKDITAKEYYDKYLKQENEEICPVCGNFNKFISIRLGYLKHCSANCAQHDAQVRLKQENTNLIKYGSKYACDSEYAKNKSKHTKLEKYGSETYNNPNKMIQTKYKKYGEYFINKEKTIKTNRKKYGCNCSFQNRNVRLKAILTSRKNGNKSSFEDMLENFFITNNINYIQEYKEERYPYFCDFYLPDIDTFIEINGYWTHGGHFFDKNNLNDLNTLKLWKEKADFGLIQYKEAINIWTIKDIAKYTTAKENNLNYVVLWNKKDIENYINSYKI